MFWNLHGFENLLLSGPPLYNASIFCLTETWLRDSPFHIPANFQDFSCHWKNATMTSEVGRPSGGLGTLSKLPLTMLSICSHWIFSKVLFGNHNLIVVNIYVKPSSNFNSFLEKLQILLDRIDETCEDDLVVIGGDLNARVGGSGSLPPDLFDDTACYEDVLNTDKFINDRGFLLNDFMTKNGFVLVNGRVAGDRPAGWTFLNHQGSSVIDLVYVRAAHLHLIHDLKVDSTMPFSDHFPVILSLRYPALDYVLPAPSSSQEVITLTNTPISRPKWHPLDQDALSVYWESINNSLINVNCHTCVTPDKLSECLHNAIHNAASQAGLMQTLNSRPRKHPYSPPWALDPELLSRRRELAVCNRKFKLNKHCVSSRNLYSQKRRDYKSCIKFKKKEYKNLLTESLNNSTNSASFWKIFKKIKPKPEFTCKVSIEEWNVFCRGIYPPRDFPIFIPTTIVVPELEQHVTLTELEAVLKNLKNNKATGPDLIANEFYAALPLSGKVCIVELFNLVLDTEICPEEWSKVLLTIIFKRGDKTDPNNYRGIALVNHLTKIFTYVLQVRIERWAKINNILTLSQFGFMIGRGCTEAIFTLVTAIQL